MTIILFNKKRNRDDFGGDAASAKQITVGSSIQGTIEHVGDEDWFKISLSAGATYEFTLTDVLGTGWDPVLSVKNSSGAVVASDDDSGGGRNAKITYVPTYTGTHYLIAGGYNNAHTGVYSLSTLYKAPPPPPVGTPANWSNVAIHVVTDGSSIYDVTGRTTVSKGNAKFVPSGEWVGNSYGISTVGNGYGYFPDRADFNLTAATWTMEIVVMFTGAGGVIVANDTQGANHDFSLRTMNGKTQLMVATSGTTVKYTTPQFGALDNWTPYHIALVRSNGTLRIYLNGTQVGQTAMAFTNVTGNRYTLGCEGWNSPSNFANMHFADFRFVKNEAVYTSNFEVPWSWPYG